MKLKPMKYFMTLDYMHNKTVIETFLGDSYTFTFVFGRSFYDKYRRHARIFTTEWGK